MKAIIMVVGKWFCSSLDNLSWKQLWLFSLHLSTTQ